MPHSTRSDRSVPRTPPSSKRPPVGTASSTQIQPKLWHPPPPSTVLDGLRAALLRVAGFHIHRPRRSTYGSSCESLDFLYHRHGPRRSVLGSRCHFRVIFAEFHPPTKMLVFLHHRPRSATVGIRFPLPFPDDFGSISSTNQDVGLPLPSSTVRDDRYTVPVATSRRFSPNFFDIHLLASTRRHPLVDNRPLTSTRRHPSYDIQPPASARWYPPVGILPPKSTCIHSTGQRSKSIQSDANQSIDKQANQPPFNRTITINRQIHQETPSKQTAHHQETTCHPALPTASCQ